MSEFSIVPVKDESYEGRQWGYYIYRGEFLLWHVTTGGTGDCWNIADTSTFPEEEADELHVCDLGEFIEALTALRDSEAHAANVARWA